jgi:hypothetical protein
MRFPLMIGGWSLKKRPNSIILGAWTLWNLCNRCVFYGEPPNLARGLSRPERFPLCDQEETIQHLLTGCVFAWQVWFSILSPLDLGSEAPGHTDLCFSDWWAKIFRMFSKEHRKGANSLIILIAWLLWKHRNACVFYGDSPSVSELLRQFRDEYKLWCLAGAKKPHAPGLDRVGAFGRVFALLLVVKSIFWVIVL